MITQTNSGYSKNLNRAGKTSTKNNEESDYSKSLVHILTLNLVLSLLALGLLIKYIEIFLTLQLSKRNIEYHTCKRWIWQKLLSWNVSFSTADYIYIIVFLYKKVSLAHVHKSKISHFKCLCVWIVFIYLLPSCFCIFFYTLEILLLRTTLRSLLVGL